MSFKTTWETNGILWEFEGIVPFSDLRKVNVQFYEDPPLIMLTTRFLMAETLLAFY